MEMRSPIILWETILSTQLESNGMLDSSEDSYWHDRYTQSVSATGISTII